MSLLPHKYIGPDKMKVSSIGLGCMGMSEFYGPINSDKDSIQLIQNAIDLGITLFDTADMYGRGHNEELLGKALKGVRSQVIIATKFGVVRNSSDASYFGLCGRPEYVKQACEKSLLRMKTDYIDLLFYHRLDPDVPLEETIGAMSDLIHEGKIKGIGLSKTPYLMIQKAQKIFPITALQSEYSLWSREVEKKILPFCSEQNIAFISYSPLGRGYLTGAIQKRSDLSEDDYRLGNPKFSEEMFEKNRIYLDALRKIAKDHDATLAQVSLAWLLHQTPNIIPIPGTRNLEKLIENIASLQVNLSIGDLKFLDQI